MQEQQSAGQALGNSSRLAASAGGWGSSMRAGRALPGAACWARNGAAAALPGVCHVDTALTVL